MAKKKLKWKKNSLFLEIGRTFLLFVVILLLFDIVWGVSFPSEKKTVGSVTLEVPKFLWVHKEEEGMVQFQTFRSMAALRKDFKKIIKDYEVISCIKDDFYYNEEENVTILSYEVKRGLLWNSLVIHSQKGKAICEEEKETVSPCTFTRTYTVSLISEHPDSQKIYVTLSTFQGETETVTLSSLWKNLLTVNQTYEFQFQKVDGNKVKDDSIQGIFQSYTLKEVKPTDKVGLEQLQEAICE